MIPAAGPPDSLGPSDESRTQATAIEIEYDGLEIPLRILKNASAEVKQHHRTRQSTQRQIHVPQAFGGNRESPGCMDLTPDFF